MKKIGGTVNTGDSEKVFIEIPRDKFKSEYGIGLPEKIPEDKKAHFKEVHKKHMKNKKLEHCGCSENK